MIWFKVFYFILNTYYLIKIFYPEKYEEFCINISFKLIRIYSRGQIIFNKLYYLTNNLSNTLANTLTNTLTNNIPYLKHFYFWLKEILKKIYNSNNKFYEICEIDKHGNIDKKYFAFDKRVYLEENKKVNYILSHIKVEDFSTVNKIILRSLPFSGYYELSDIKFMLFEIKLGDIYYNINLSTDKYNYYIVNNILDKNFLIFFLKNHTSLSCHLSYYNDVVYDNYTIDKFDINLIDNNINFKKLEITDEKYIMIDKNDYYYKH
jgi:hypothetical protein